MSALAVNAGGACHDVGHARLVVVDIKIEKTVVVVIPEPAGEAHRGSVDTNLAGNVAKLAAALIVV